MPAFNGFDGVGRGGSASGVPGPSGSRPSKQSGGPGRLGRPEPRSFSTRGPPPRSWPPPCSPSTGGSGGGLVSSGPPSCPPPFSGRSCPDNHDCRQSGRYSEMGPSAEAPSGGLGEAASLTAQRPPWVSARAPLESRRLASHSSRITVSPICADASSVSLTASTAAWSETSIASRVAFWMFSSMFCSCSITSSSSASPSTVWSPPA
mmetsp:Transcript_30868/g.97071  ORF Transcript_30868/g.97071 Transcript_30868/m.97071 type:complete len:206 (+) Transcript_30868:97-714(+)